MHARCGTHTLKRTFNQWRKSSAERLVLLRSAISAHRTVILEELKWPSLEQRRKQTRLTNLYMIENGTLALVIPNYFRQKKRQTRNYHPLKFVNAGCRTNIYKYSFFPGQLKNGTNFPKQLLQLPTQRPSSLPLYITSTNSLHCFSAHTARAQHISAEDGLHCPLQIRHLDLDLDLEHNSCIMFYNY